MISGIEALKTSAEFKEIVPVFAMVMPPVAANGVTHSKPATCDVAVL